MYQVTQNLNPGQDTRARNTKKHEPSTVPQTAVPPTTHSTTPSLTHHRLAHVALRGARKPARRAPAPSPPRAPPEPPPYQEVRYDIPPWTTPRRDLRALSFICAIFPDSGCIGQLQRYCFLGACALLVCIAWVGPNRVDVFGYMYRPYGV